MKKEINQRVVHYRRLAGLTQRDVASNLGIKQSTYQRIESKGNIKTEMLKDLAKMFNISIDLLIYGKKNDDSNSEQKTLIDIIRGTDEPVKPFTKLESPNIFEEKEIEKNEFSINASKRDRDMLMMYQKLSRDEQQEIFSIVKNKLYKK